MYRVQKILSKIGYCSRRHAESLIESGQVKINDRVVNLGDKWQQGDTLMVNDQEIDLTMALDQKIEFIKYYKPLGEVVSRNDPNFTKTVFDHLPDVDGKWINIGRLDVNTTGLILFTNNGDMANKIMHPSFNFEREYIVKIDKPLGKKDISSLEKGVPINDNSIGRFNKIINLTNNSYKITLSTGKYREVRYSLQYLNFKTISLHRVRYSNVYLDDMSEGEHRLLSESERSNFLF